MVGMTELTFLQHGLSLFQLPVFKKRQQGFFFFGRQGNKPPDMCQQRIKHFIYLNSP
jgi:hypothetical protein